MKRILLIAIQDKDVSAKVCGIEIRYFEKYYFRNRSAKRVCKNPIRE